MALPALPALQAEANWCVSLFEVAMKEADVARVDGPREEDRCGPVDEHLCVRGFGEVVAWEDGLAFAMGHTWKGRPTRQRIIGRSNPEPRALSTRLPGLTPAALRLE